MDNRPIGVFDSGLGGLTCVKELKNILPHEDIIYFGDTGRVPYGTRSDKTIIKYAKQDIAFLLEKNIKMIIVACGTVSSVALKHIEDDYDIPVIGVLEPAVLKAKTLAKTGKIGIIGTGSTIGSGAYEKALEARDITTKSLACPLFVSLVENGYENHEVAHIVSKEYFEPFITYKPEILIMGCTHYPIMKNVFKKILGEIDYIDPGKETAIYAKKLLERKDMKSEKEIGTYKFFVSDEVYNFKELASKFLGEDIGDNIERIDIEKY